eukprot:TRINITY_DN21720_c0_g1_i1.p1 TRINITY_DN21720_c0_g1~~TRINITY_DN21720_c0_g1_i1.p1  ORF type:complete len:231 (+),score=70.81 TRINITY_DN21720_c0_g1_i1:139-831(+)
MAGEACSEGERMLKRVEEVQRELAMAQARAVEAEDADDRAALSQRVQELGEYLGQCTREHSIRTQLDQGSVLVQRLCAQIDQSEELCTVGAELVAGMPLNQAMSAVLEPKVRALVSAHSETAAHRGLLSEALDEERAAVSALEAQLSEGRGQGLEEGEEEQHTRAVLRASEQERVALREGQRALHVEVSRLQREVEQERRLNARYESVLQNSTQRMSQLTAVQKLSLIHI